MRHLIAGFLLVLAGIALPFLMVARLVPYSLVLAAVAYAASLAGVVLGCVGASRVFPRR